MYWTWYCPTRGRLAAWPEKRQGDRMNGPGMTDSMSRWMGPGYGLCRSMLTCMGGLRQMASTSPDREPLLTWQPRWSTCFIPHLWCPVHPPLDPPYDDRTTVHPQLQENLKIPEAKDNLIEVSMMASRMHEFVPHLLTFQSRRALV